MRSRERYHSGIRLLREINIQLTSPMGTYPITATLTGIAAANYLLTVVPGTLTITLAESTTTLTSSSSTVTAGQSVTFTAAVQSGTTSVTGGTVTFLNGVTPLALAH
jgi:hypothetical protein